MSDPVGAYFDHAQLSIAAYANLTPGMTNDDYKTALKNNGFSDSQAIAFISTYSIVKVFNDPATDFSATLFQKSGSPEKILAIRGTESWLDLLISDLQIGVFGLTNQYASLENFSAQILAQLQPTDTFIVTGHSLGGFLAQAFTLDHQITVSHTYTYNSPGLGGVLINPVGQLGITANPVPNSLITNLIAQGHSFVSSTGSQFGTPRDIFIETSINPLDNHGKGSITDSLALYDLFAKVDPNLSQNLSAITGILEAESSESANSLEKGLDALRKLFGDSAITETPISFPGDDPSSAARNTYYTNLISLRNGLPSGSFEVRSLIAQPTNVLTTQAQTEIAYRYALKELNPFVVLGANYTPHNETGELTQVNPDTGIGDLTPQYLIDRAAFLAKKIEVNSSIFTVPSSTYFKDNQLQEEIGSAMLPLPQMLFGNGSNEILTGSLFRADHLYGGSGDDQLLGQGGNDYLEGNRGDDTLDGGSGADTMLGGQGNDTYIVDNTGDVVREYANSGIDIVHSSVTFTLDSQVENLTLTGANDLNGTGNELNNTLTGNSGINRLDGKGGTDHLIGGLGNDILAGGTGENDLLEGGAGFDTYIYNSGDGTDQIEDSDATGRIVFNRTILQGSISTDNGAKHLRSEKEHLAVYC